MEMAPTRTSSIRASNVPPGGEGFFARWARIVRQKLAAKEREVDDPAEAIDVLLQNQMESVAQGRNDLLAVTSAEKRLEGMLAELEARIRKYDENARAALSAGNAEAARSSVRRQIECERLLEEGRANLAEVAAQRSELNELLEQMRAEYDRLRMRREAVRALASGARGSVASQESLTAAGSAGRERELGLETARETLARLRARSQALAQLRASGSLDALGAGEFDSRSIGEAEVDRRLSALNP